MKALISPQQNNMVVQVSANNKIFQVAEPLHWVTCTSSIKAYEFQYINDAFVPYVPQPLIPSTVSMRQARIALLQSNLLDTVNAAINQGGEADKIKWEYATEVNRSDSLVQNMAIALQLSESDLDNLFILAATL
jgi:hypothetical protein